MFFKEGLQRRRGRVLELGCGNGNNLLLFTAFGWDVTGVDRSSDALADARHNLEGVGTFIEYDLTQDFPIPAAALFDAILLPNVAYYLPRSDFVRILRDCGQRLRPGGIMFLNARVKEDWRWGRGREEEPAGFRLECRETGELGLLNVFYAADEVAALIRKHFGELRQVQQLSMIYDNPEGGIVVRNAEIVIWGRKAAK
ncbi:MAG TPA: class I SAM-dependent methyltransferase [Steroidobacteraceae bacterium]|jgi:SAM-dependent methyltransferase|nr:class I SAM-dependent methyltransferase [Steroidobacteraceae bacterium]